MLLLRPRSISLTLLLSSTLVTAAPAGLPSTPQVRERSPSDVLDPRVTDFGSIAIPSSPDHFQSQEMPPYYVEDPERSALPQLLFEDADELDSPEPEGDSWDSQSFWRAMASGRQAFANTPVGQTLGAPSLRSFRELLPFLHRDRQVNARRSDEMYNPRMI